MTVIRIVFAFVCFSTLILIVPSLAEADVTISWDSNVESDLAGYQILYGLAPRTYTSIVDIGNSTSHQFTNLEPGRTYYFSVRAYDRDGLTSPLSAEVSTTNRAAAALSLPNLLMSHKSPVKVGTRLVFGAAAAGGMPPYQYQWFISVGRVTTVLRTWSTEATTTWTPPSAGRYTLSVWVRSAASNANAPDNVESVASIPFEVVP